jgi:MscS family membrane protein
MLQENIMQNILEWITDNSDMAILIGELSFLIGITLGINFLIYWGCQRLKSKSLKTKFFWDDVIVHSLSAPAIFLTSILGLSYAADVINNFYEEISIGSALAIIRQLGLILAFSWFLLNIVQKTEKQLVLKKKIDRKAANISSKIISTLIFLITCLFTLQAFGISISGLLAFGGIGGIILGFASKDLLSNFFGSFMLYLDRPFQAGDWIRFPTNQIEGKVEKIGLRTTRIANLDSRTIYIPNNMFTQIIFENLSDRQRFNLHHTIRLRYQDLEQTPIIVKELKEMLQSNSNIDNSMPLFVHFDSFGFGSLHIEIYAFTTNADAEQFKATQQDVLMEAGKIVKKNKGEITFYYPNAQPFD